MFYKSSQKLMPILKKILKPPEPNVRGERDIEYSWVLENFPDSVSQLLDFGCGDTFLIPLFASRKGIRVTAIDIQQHVPWQYKYPNFDFIQGDLFNLHFQPEQFDFIINCSSVEHVGLKGRYDIKEYRPDGDIEAMNKLKDILKTGKEMILTVPVGKDSVFSPFHRVYGKERLPKLITGGWSVLRKEYWIKDKQNIWSRSDEPSALSVKPTEYYYGLGLFVLQKEK